LTVAILGERWSSILVSANAPAAIWSGHAALRQTEIGQVSSFELSGEYCSQRPSLIAEVSFQEPRGDSQQPSQTKYTRLTGLIREFFGILP
jgi:hypothetical protein